MVKIIEHDATKKIQVTREKQETFEKPKCNTKIVRVYIVSLGYHLFVTE